MPGSFHNLSGSRGKELDVMGNILALTFFGKMEGIWICLMMLPMVWRHRK